MNTKVIKIVGIVANVVGIAASLASNWSTTKQQDSKIAEEVAKAVADHFEKKES